MYKAENQLSFGKLATGLEQKPELRRSLGIKFMPSKSILHHWASKTLAKMGADFFSGMVAGMAKGYRAAEICGDSASLGLTSYVVWQHSEHGKIRAHGFAKLHIVECHKGAGNVLQGDGHPQARPAGVP